jgi:5-formyltetrahydrofolate cyclo-ligase
MKTDEIHSLKNKIRQEIRDLKKQISVEEKQQKSQSIFQQLEINPAFENAKIIMCYWAMPDEVQTQDFIMKWYLKKTFLLPVVKGDELELRVFQGVENMQTGSAFGIQEPSGAAFQNHTEIDVIIVPGVAFDKQRNRLGRGKAYYDTLLKMASKAQKIGVCFDFQLLEKVPIEVHDVAMDEVLTG